MKNKIGIALFTAFLAVVLLVSGCSNFDGSAAAKSGEGNLILNIQGIGGARTIQPVLTYVATLTPATGDAITLNLLAGPNVLNVAPGTYDIEVEAYNGEVLVATGSADDVEVTEDSVATANISLDPETLDGGGIFTWNLIDFTGTTVDIKIYAIDDLDGIDGIDELTDPDKTGDALSGSVDLDPGFYYVVFDVDGIVWTEILWIADGMVSDYVNYFDNIGLGDAQELLKIVLDEIADGTYTFTAPDLVALNIAGVTNTNIGDIRTAFSTILADTDNNTAPVNVAELKNLVDAALISSLAFSVDTSVTAAAEVDIKAFVANGTTGVTFNWTEYVSPDYKVTITVDAYTVTVVILPPVEPEFIDTVTLNQGNAVYRFVLPSGATFGDYKTIKVSYKVANVSDGNFRNFRLMGNYAATKFTLANDNRFMVAEFNGGSGAAFNNSNAQYIYDTVPNGDAMSGIANDTWFTVTYLLVGNRPNDSFANKPADDAIGPFFFGIGIQGNTAKSQSIKNITMVHKTDPTKNVVTDDFYGFAGYAFANGNPGEGQDSRYTDFTFTRDENPLYDGDPSTFDLDLEEEFTGSIATGAHYGGQAVNNYSVGVLTISYDGAATGDRQAGVIPLSTDQIAQIMAPETKYLLVTIDGSTSATSQFRWCLGDATLGASWNGTSLIGFAAFSEGTKLLTFDNNIKTNGIKDATKGNLVSNFLIQINPKETTDVEINSITIRCMK